MTEEKVPRDPTCEKVTSPWQAHIQKILRLPFPFPWLVIALAFSAIGSAISICLEGKCNFTLLWPMIVLSSLLIATTSNAVVLYNKMFREWLLPGIRPILQLEGSELYEWESQLINRVFYIRRNITIGIILGLAVVFVNFRGGMVFKSIIGQIFQGVLFFSIGLTGGSMFYVLIALAYSCYKLGSGDLVKVSILEPRTGRTKLIPRFILRVCYVAILVYILGVCIVPCIPHRLGRIQVGIPIGFGFFVLAYFIFSQFGMHRVIREAKMKRLDVLLPQIERSFDQVVENPSTENLSRLRDLFQLQTIINAKQTWGVGWREFLALFASIVVPFLVCLLQWALGRN